MPTLPPDYMRGFFTRAAQLDQRRQRRRATGNNPQHYTKLNPTYTY